MMRGIRWDIVAGSALVVYHAGMMAWYVIRRRREDERDPRK